MRRDVHAPRTAGAVLRLLCVAFAAAVTAGSASAQYPTFTELPTLQPSANVAAPLVATVHVETDVPTLVWLSIDNGERNVFVPGDGEFATEHDVLVYGVEPDKNNLISVLAVDQKGYQSTSPVVLDFQTPPLPPEFPPLEVQTLDEMRREPGYVLIGPRGFAGPTTQFLVLLDGAGRVVWYLQGFTGGEQLRNGNFFVTRQRDLTSVEIDIQGNVVREWYASRLNGGAGATPGAILVDVDSMHHEFTEMPEDEEADFLVLGSEARLLPNYPVSEATPSLTEPLGNVIGDVIFEMRADGTVVREKKLLDILDPYRIGYDSVEGPYWNPLYGAGSRDWTHANSVLFDPSDDSYIVSLRHQDCVVKIRRGVDGVDSPDDVVWILGTPEGWNEPWKSKLLSLEGELIQFQPRFDQREFDLEWPFHTHHARLNAAGNLTLFDNGNYRVMPPTPKPDPASYYSRSVEYSIDEANLSVRQVWAAGGLFDEVPDRIGYSFFVSGTEHQPRTGNVLVCAGGTAEPLSGRSYTRVLELERESKEAVFDMVIRDPADAAPWVTYRALRYDHIQPMPDFEAPLLNVSPLRQLQTTYATVTGLEPGEEVLFVYSTAGRGAGPQYPGGRSGLLGAHIALGVRTAGLNGSATLSGIVPPSSTLGRELHIQAFTRRGTSNVVSARIE